MSINQQKVFTLQDKDIFLYNADILRELDLKFIEIVAENKQNDICLLVLVTRGGDADAAYKMGRYIQDNYESLVVLVPGICKSAGTLLATAASELVFESFGELGPLDVQMQKQDEFSSQYSGLNISEAFKSIEERSRDTFHQLIGEILDASSGNISIRTALHAATQMVSALYEPIFNQIDPEEVGARSRAMRIGRDYARRLNSKWGNFKSEKMIQTLTSAYPSHGFVIDHIEARNLFKRVRMTNEFENELVKFLGMAARFPDEEPDIRHIPNDEITKTTGEPNETENIQQIRSKSRN